MLPKTRPIMAAGASSFGMSGVNAHGLFLAPRELKHVHTAVAWQHVRHWMVPQAHHMLDSVSCSRREATCRYPITPFLWPCLPATQFQVFSRKWQ